MRQTSTFSKSATLPRMPAFRRLNDLPEVSPNIALGAKTYIGGIVSARLVILVLLQNDTVFEGRKFACMKTLRGNTCRRPALQRGYVGFWHKADIQLPLALGPRSTA